MDNTLKNKIEQELKANVIVNNEKQDNLTESSLERLIKVERTGSVVLNAKETQGKIYYQCRDGFCGQCRCKLISGVVAQEKDAFSSTLNEKDFLACKSRIVSKYAVIESNMDFER